MTGFGAFSRATDPNPGASLLVNGEPSGEGLGYEFSDNLVAAIDVALWLGRPLLVTGEPGSGKTTLGYAVARRLNIERAYLFVTKSTSEARDLFYRYDALGRFRDAQAHKDTDAADYLAYQALGAHNAAVTIAAILQKGPAVKSPGGYLRTLSRKAQSGAFSLGPVLMALLKERSLSKATGFTEHAPRL